ncbi:MAG: hypothetical protein WDN06_21755 [Asticcacaulis sp.]
MSTRETWNGLMSRLAVSADMANALWADLSAAYTQPHRHYHDISHIDVLVAAFMPLRERFEDADAALLALFYHDIVYDPARPDNEERSAEWLATDFPGRARAQRHVLATKRHDDAEDADTSLVLDLDMGILGAPWLAYLAYAEGVFREYVPVHGRDAYAKGRAELFLKPTLAKPRIFLTPDFAARESQARQNLAAELALWADGGFA